MLNVDCFASLVRLLVRYWSYDMVLRFFEIIDIIYHSNRLKRDDILLGCISFISLCLFLALYFIEFDLQLKGRYFIKIFFVQLIHHLQFLFDGPLI